MATVKLFVRSSAKDQKRPVRIRVRLRAGRDIDLYANTLQVIEPVNFNNSTEKVRDKLEILDRDKINKKLRDLKGFIEDTEKKELDKTKLTKEWLELVIDKFYFPEKYQNPKGSLFAFIQDFIDKAETYPNPRTGKPVSYRVYRHYNSSFDRLKEFSKEQGKEVNFNDIDLDFYEDFKAYLQSQGLALNTIGRIIKTIKVFLNSATEKGYNTNLKYKSAKFAAPTEESETVYLNEEDIDSLTELDLTEHERLDKVRDLFLIGCWTGLRYSDFYQVTNDNIKDNLIHIRQTKTDAKVVVPVHPTVQSILDKYKGKLPAVISNQKFNVYLKEVTEKAELNEIVEKSITKGGVKKTTKYKKWELVRSHTARRSFATNLYKAGFPTQSIMAITGHKTEAAFLKYLKVTPVEHAQLLNDFWIKKQLEKEAEKEGNNE